jgi:hypothetical protein
LDISKQNRLLAVMKKSPSRRAPPNPVDADEILPEYDFKRGSPNRFASRYAAGSAVVVLDPDVAAAFPSSAEANEASARPLKRRRDPAFW